MAVRSMRVADLSTGPVFGAAGEVVLPTVNKDNGFGKGVGLVEPFLAFGQELPRDAFVQARAGWRFPPRR